MRSGLTKIAAEAEAAPLAIDPESKVAESARGQIEPIQKITETISRIRAGPLP